MMLLLTRQILLVAAVGLSGLSLAGDLIAQSNSADSPIAEEVVAATVGEAKITAARVQRHLDRMLGERRLSDKQIELLRAEALDHFVNREIVNHFLELRGYEVGPNQIRMEVELLIGELDRVGQTLEEFLAKDSRSKVELEREIEWKIRWKSYLTKTLTEEVLKSYFENRRRRFDGTELKVAQVLFRTLDSPESVDAAMKLATSEKAKIEAGEITWNVAVERNSIAASKSKQGEIGWIRFAEPMPRDFTDRAFALDVGEISEPFASKFGIHLLKCLEVKPGQSEYGDVMQAVEVAATKELFERIANRHVTEVSVQYGEGWGPKS